MRSFHRKLRWLLAATLIATILSGSTPAKPLNIPVVYYKLPNGLRVVISEDHVAPVVTVAVYYNVGFRIEPKGRTGFAHLFEHMMFQGSANVKKFEHAKYVEANGGSLNGHTDFDYTNYFETLPSDRVEMGLWLESDRMRSLDVTPENLKNQQNVVSEEVRVNVLNQPYGLFEWIDLWGNANQNYYNSHNGYGDLKDIEAATLEDVRSFFKTYYAPNNAVLTIAGDVDANDVKKMVEKYFTSIPSQPRPAIPDITEPPQTKEKRVTEPDKLATVPALAVGYHAPDQKSADFAPVVLLNLILQGDESSRFYQRLVKEKELSLDLAGGVNYFGNEFDYYGPMLITTRSTYKTGHTADEIVKEMDAVLADVAQNGVTAKELADAKVRFRSNFYNQLESSFGKAHLLSSLALFRDDPAQINTALEPFENVTVAQIKAVAKKYYVPENRTVVDRVPEQKGGK
ncbi:MAG TPA: pitrilysin family protein [Pyrinomonadaceae bacterium]|jgi:predicted Zn-dependent peptidase|nr:pitrilysin family protein [Pyrinomonadaceae bacterium]